MFARHFARLPPKPDLDAYTTMQILNVRAQWAIDESKDVIASPDGANWTVCMDREVSLKEAVQSRTVFLTEVDSWREILPLLGPKVQTVGLALGDLDESLALCRGGHAGRRGPLRAARHYEQLRVALGRQARSRATRPLGHAEAVTAVPPLSSERRHGVWPRWSRPAQSSHSPTEQLPDNLLTVHEKLPRSSVGPFSQKTKTTAHQRTAGNDARGHGKRVLFGLLGRYSGIAVAKDRAEEEQQAVVPVEGPRQANAGGRRNPFLILGETLWTTRAG